MGQAAESGATMLQLEMAVLKGLGTNVADTVTLGGYATYQYRNGDINDSEYGDRILGVGLNFLGGAGLLKAAGLGKVTVAQAGIGGVRAISTGVSRVIDVARQIELNPAALTQFNSGIPLNLLRWKQTGNPLAKIAEGFGTAAERAAPNSLPTPSAGDLSKLGSAAGKGDLTKAGHSLSKHASGKRAGSSAFPDPKGSPAQINQQAQKLLDDILNDPARMLKQRPGRPGEQLLQIFRPDGSGVIYKRDGTQWVFSHFAENLF